MGVHARFMIVPLSTGVREPLMYFKRTPFGTVFQDIDMRGKEQVS